MIPLNLDLDMKHMLDFINLLFLNKAGVLTF